MNNYYKFFYYKVRQGLLQIATDITKCDDYYKVRQYTNTFLYTPISIKVAPVNHVSWPAVH